MLQDENKIELTSNDVDSKEEKIEEEEKEIDLDFILNEEDSVSLTEEQQQAKITDAKSVLARQLLEEAVVLLERIKHLMGPSADFVEDHSGVAELDDDEPEGRVVEGVFDGQKMVGPEGKHYSVPANYASKSKLVEGDLLKLTITPKGAFVYKQIGPIARRRILGTLIRNPFGNEWVVKTDGKNYFILTASVTYFHGDEGDEVTIIVPESGESKWAAVENIIKNNQ